MRIWAPNRRLLWGTTLSFSISIPLAFWMVISHAIGMMYIPFSLIAGFCTCIAALRRPCYITTDDTGIGITTRQGSRALRWSEIRSAEKLSHRWHYHSRVQLHAPDRVEINLVGYPTPLRGELFALIVDHAKLAPKLTQKSLYMRKLASIPSARRS